MEKMRAHQKNGLGVSFSLCAKNDAINGRGLGMQNNDFLPRVILIGDREQHETPFFSQLALKFKLGHCIAVAGEGGVFLSYLCI